MPRRWAVAGFIACLMVGGSVGRASDTMVVPQNLLQASQRQALALERIARALEEGAPAVAVPVGVLERIDKHLEQMARASLGPFTMDEYPEESDAER